MIFKRLILILFLLTASLAANDLKDHVDLFIKQNHDIAKWNEDLKSADEVSSGKINQEIKACKNTKGTLLASFAALINDKNLNKKFFKELKSGNSSNKKADLSFYACLDKLSKAFIAGRGEDAKTIIEASLDELKAINQSPSIELDSYIELLNYLRLNTDIFKSSFVLQNLDLIWISNYINSFIPRSITDHINVGKLSLCLLIIAAMLLLKKLVLKLIFALLILTVRFSKRNFDLEANNHFFNSLSRPIIWLFYSYAIQICSLIAFYPAPTPPLILKIFSVIHVALTTWLIIAAFNGYGMAFISSFATKSGRKDAINLIIKIANYIIFVISILVALAFWGFDVSAIIASLGIGGLAVALAAKDIIANFFASVLLHFDNSFSQGDWVHIGAVEGTVVEVGMRKTAIRTFDNSLVFVPNSQIMNSNIKNWSRRKLGRKIGLSIGLEYSTSADSVAKILADIRQMLKTHPDIAQPDFDNFKHAKNIRHRYRQNMVSIDDLDGYKNTLFVYLDEFAESSINIYVYCFSKSIVWGEFLRVKEDVMLKIMKIIEENGSGFAFPSQSVYLEDTPTARSLFENTQPR